MIAQCPHCKTKYSVPSNKIPAKGRKAVCKKCKNYFVVSLPPKKISREGDIEISQETRITHPSAQQSTGDARVRLAHPLDKRRRSKLDSTKNDVIIKSTNSSSKRLKAIIVGVAITICLGLLVPSYFHYTSVDPDELANTYARAVHIGDTSACSFVDIEDLKYCEAMVSARKRELEEAQKLDNISIKSTLTSTELKDVKNDGTRLYRADYVVSLNGRRSKNRDFYFRLKKVDGDWLVFHGKRERKKTVNLQAIIEPPTIPTKAQKPKKETTASKQKKAPIPKTQSFRTEQAKRHAKELADMGYPYGEESLFKAINNKDHRAVRLLLELGISTSSVDPEMERGGSALMMSIFSGCTDCLKAIIEYGCKPTVEDCSYIFSQKQDHELLRLCMGSDIDFIQREPKIYFDGIPQQAQDYIRQKTRKKHHKSALGRYDIFHKNTHIGYVTFDNNGKLCFLQVNRVTMSPSYFIFGDTIELQPFVEKFGIPSKWIYSRMDSTGRAVYTPKSGSQYYMISQKVH